MKPVIALAALLLCGNAEAGTPQAPRNFVCVNHTDRGVWVRFYDGPVEIMEWFLGPHMGVRQNGVELRLTQGAFSYAGNGATCRFNLKHWPKLP